MVSDGFTPRFAETAAPSTTEMPGWPWRRWYGSITPVSGEAPIGQPPRKWAVRGMPVSSPTLEPAQPLISAASADAPSVAALICLGLGAPCTWRAVSSPLPTPDGLSFVVRELSSDCITRAMMVRSDQRRLDSERTISRGCRAALPSQPSTRAAPEPRRAYGTWRMDRAPIELEP